MAAATLVSSLTVLALAEPQRVGEPVERVKAARDVVLAIDISAAMDARDFEDGDGERRRRLEAVKGVVADFVAGREGDRMGLIVFGSKAYVQAPLTEDLDAIPALLDRTEVGMAVPHTALGDAIGLAIRTFEASGIEREQSDTGEDVGIGADEIVFDNEADRGAETRIEAPRGGDAAMLTADRWMTTVDTRTGDFLRSRFALEAARGPATLDAGAEAAE